jgi:hypothetical protein
MVFPASERDEEIEIYTPERKAEFLLNNAIDDDDYAAARRAVYSMGLDPDAIDHDRPPPSQLVARALR